MSTDVENRVVEMRFDNKHFESNVQTSLSTLEKLKQSLNLSGAAKGLQTIDSAARKVDMSSMGNAVETVRLRFSALEVMAVTALANITNSAINTGKRLVSALTIDPVKTGLSEYETQINAVQTILANTEHKGTTLDQVNVALDELNKYADKTIYNFTEMTRNIGTFTAAGVDLDKSVTSIKGIANLAAVSGSTSQQASTAMYQLSQALATGTVKLMDWNSVVNAGMGGQVFQNALTRTAAVMAGASKDVEGWRKKNIDAYGSFRDSLTEGEWLTAEVLTETLSQLSGAYTEADLIAKGYTKGQAEEILKLAKTAEDAATKVKTVTQLWDTLKEAAQSGWTQTWEILVGDFEEAKELWSNVSDVVGGFINKASDSRNKLLEGAMTSNWDKLIERINEAGIETSEFEKRVKEVAKDHGQDFDKLVKKYGSFEEACRSGAISSDILKESVNGFKKIAEGVDLSLVDRILGVGKKGEDVKQVEDALKKLGYTLTGKDGRDYSNDGYFGTLTEEAIKDFQKLNNLKVTGIVDDKTLAALKEATAETEELEVNIDDLVDGVTKLGGREMLIESFSNIFKGLGSIIKPVALAFKSIFPPITVEGLYSFIEGFHSLTEKFKLSVPQTRKIYQTFKGLFSILDIGWMGIKTAAGIVGKALGKIFGHFSGLGNGILDVTSKIGLWFTKLRNYIKETDGMTKAFTMIGEGIKVVYETVKKWVKAFLEIPEVKASIDKLKKSFSDMFSGIKAYFGGGLERIKAFIESIKSMDSISLDDLSTIFENFKTGVIDYFLTFDASSMFAGIKNALSNFKNTVKKVLDPAGEKFDAIKEKLVAFAEFVKSKLPAAIAIGMGVMLISGVSKLGKSLEIIAAPLEGLQGIFDSISNGIKGFSKSLKKVANAKAFEARTEGIKNLAISIGILAISLTVLSKLDQGKMWSAVGALTALAVVMIGLSWASNKFGGIADMGKSAGSILALSGALLILTFCLKTMAGLDTKKALVNAGILAGLAVILATIVGVLSKFAPKLATGSLTFITLAGGIAIMVGALKTLDGIKFNNIGQSVGLLAGIVAALAVLAVATKGVKFGSLAGVIAMAVGLKVMVSVIEDIAEIDSNKIMDNLSNFALVFAGLIILMAATKLAGKNAAVAGIGILAISAAIILIIKAVDLLADMDQAGVSKAITNISKILLVFGFVIAATLLAGKHAIKAGVSMLAMSGAILIMVGAIALLKEMDPAGVDRAVEAIGKLLLFFSIAIIATKFAGSAIGSIIVMTVAVGILALAVAGLSFIKPDGLENAVSAITQVMLVFALLMVSSKFITGSMGPLIAMTIAVGVLAGVIYLLHDLPIESTLGIAGSLSLLILSLAGACTILGMVNPAGALSGVGALAVFIAGVAAIMAVIAGLNMLMPEMNSFLESSLPTLELIGKGIGSVIGGIIGGIGEGVSGSLPQMGTDLSNFMTNLQTFITGAKDIDATVVDGIASLVSVVTSLSAASFLEGLTSFITGTSSVDSFSTQLTGLVGAVTSFATTASTLTEDDIAKITSVSGAMDALVGLADKVPATGGLTQAILGAPDLVSFANGVAELGPAISGFVTSVATMTAEDESKIKSVAGAAGALTDLAAKIPETGGLAQAILGAPDLVSFANGVAKLGPAIGTFATSITEITEDDLTKMSSVASAAESLTTLADKIPAQEGLAQAILGAPSLATFAGEMETFGGAVKTFVTSVSEVTETDINKIKSIGKAAISLVDMSASLSKYNDSSWFNTNLTEFAGEMKTFGEKIAEFAGSVADVSFDNISVAISNARTVLGLAVTLEKYNTAELTVFGGNIVSFGQNIVTFYNTIKKVDTEKLSSAVSSMSTLATTVKSLADINYDGISSFDTALGNLAKVGIDGFINAFSKSEGQIRKAGVDMIKSFIAGAELMQLTVKSKFKTISTNGAEALRTAYSSFYLAGKYVVEGFAAGISVNTYRATAKARAMAASALSAAKSALQIKSPSRAFYSVGAFAGQGFVNALSDYASKAYDVSAEMARYARDGLTNALSRISDVVENGMDSQPTIRPVLDLSEVSAGVGTINDMFGMNPSVGLLGNVGSINAMMNRRIQNGTNDDVISAIENLGRRIGDMPRNTYQVNGVTYDDGSNIAGAVGQLIRAMRVEGRT